MGLQAAPGYLGSGNYQHPATLDRDVIRRLTGLKSGVFDSGDFVVAPTTGLNVTITKGAASMLGTDSPAVQGHYYAWSDATETKACVAAHATLKRVDALVLRAVDAAYSGGYTQGAVWEWISGTPASSPTAPTDGDINGGGNYKPGSWIRIANVQINNGDTVVDPSRITDTRIWTTNANGKIYAANSTARGLIANKNKGDECYQNDTGMVWQWNGSLWYPQPGTAVARIHRTLSATITSGNVIPYDAEDVDLLAGHDNTTNNSRWTCVNPGRYGVRMVNRHGVVADGTAITGNIKINGTNVGPTYVASANSSGSAGTAYVMTESLNMAAADYVEASVGNALASAVNCQNSLMVVTFEGYA